MVSINKNEICEIEKEEFAYRFIQKISEKKLLSSLFSELESETQLDFLSTLGIPDAHAYKRKSKKRIRTYLKSKNPALIFKKKGLSDKKACQRLLTNWSFDVIDRILESKDLPDDQAKKDPDPPDKIFISAIKHFYEKGTLQQTYNIIASFIANPLFPSSFDPSEENELIETLKEPSENFLGTLIHKLEDQYLKEMDDVEIKISNLKNQYADLSKVLSKFVSQIKEFGELPHEKLFESIEELRNSFNELRELILDNAEQIGYQAQERKTYNSLNELIILSEEIRGFENSEQIRNIENAKEIIHQLRRIEIEGSQKDEKLISFFDHIDNKKESWIEDKQIVEELCSGQHPFAMLITAIVEKDRSKETCKKLKKCLAPYCYSKDLVGHLVLNLATEDLSLRMRIKIINRTGQRTYR